MNIYKSYIIHYVTLQITMRIYFSLRWNIQRAVQTVQAFQKYRKHTSCRRWWRAGRSWNANNANKPKRN